MPPITISEIAKENLSVILKTAENFWGGPVIIAHGKSFQIDQLPGFKATSSGQFVGFLHYELREDDCEILTLASLDEGRGVGTALLSHVEALAKKKGLHLIHLVTTNDNLHALGFYQRRGYHISAVFPGQIEISRQLKPSIPLIGENRIPIRDEIRLEKNLDIENAIQ